MSEGTNPSIINNEMNSFNDAKGSCNQDAQSQSLNKFKVGDFVEVNRNTSILEYRDQWCLAKVTNIDANDYVWVHFYGINMAQLQPDEIQIPQKKNLIAPVGTHLLKFELEEIQVGTAVHLDKESLELREKKENRVEVWNGPFNIVYDKKLTDLKVNKQAMDLPPICHTHWTRYASGVGITDKHTNLMFFYTNSSAWIYDLTLQERVGWCELPQGLPYKVKWSLLRFDFHDLKILYFVPRQKTYTVEFQATFNFLELLPQKLTHEYRKLVDGFVRKSADELKISVPPGITRMIMWYHDLSKLGTK